MAFLWAAYQTGSFADMLMPDLPLSMFPGAMEGLIATGDYEWIVEVAGRPVGIFMGRSVAAGRGAEIQVDWFDWATPRNRIEAAAAFLTTVSRTLKIFLYVPAESPDFLSRLARYRIVRKGCKIVNYFGGGDDAMMFYSPGPF